MQIERVEQTAQVILDAREIYRDSTLADLYNPISMSKELVNTHRGNDKAVDACYVKRNLRTKLKGWNFYLIFTGNTQTRLLSSKKSQQRNQKERNAKSNKKWINSIIFRKPAVFNRNRSLRHSGCRFVTSATS